MRNPALGWMLAIGLSMPLLASADKPYTEELAPEGNRSLLLRPAKDDPAGQLAYARMLQQDGEERAADKQFRALVRTWPTAPEAADAQYLHALYLEGRGKLEKAFDAYQLLVDNYPGRFPYEKVLERQFDLALKAQDHRRMAFFGLPGFASPEQAVPLLEALVRNGPRWDKAPEAHFLIGQIREQNEEYELAIVSYLETQLRYPRSPYAEDAYFARARCQVALSEQSPNDRDLENDAWYTLDNFNTAHPHSEHREEVAKMWELINNKRAERAFEIARYYDRTAKRPAAALSAYQTFARLHPYSEWTELAEERITALKQIVEPPRAD